MLTLIAKLELCSDSWEGLARSKESVEPRLFESSDLSKLSFLGFFVRLECCSLFSMCSTFNFFEVFWPPGFLRDFPLVGASLVIFRIVPLFASSFELWCHDDRFRSRLFPSLSFLDVSTGFSSTIIVGGSSRSFLFKTSFRL